MFPIENNNKEKDVEPMGTLCSIYHAKLHELIEITGSTNTAVLLDYILMHWQKSKYTLRGQEGVWFMDEYQSLAKKFHCHRNTIYNRIKSLKEKGLIETAIERYARNRNNVCTIQNGAYIRPTQKLLEVILKSNSDEQLPSAMSIDKQSKQKNRIQSPCDIKRSHHPNNCDFENTTIVTPIYKYKDSKSFINNISQIFSGDKVEFNRNVAQFKSIEQFFFVDIKEEVPTKIKKLLLGTLGNLIFQHKKIFTNPKQIAAEYLFVFLNNEYFMPKVCDIYHRNNILAKKIKLNAWKTPYGFYKHCWLAYEFKSPKDREDEARRLKEKELGRSAYNQTSHINDIIQRKESSNHDLDSLENKMQKTVHKIEQLNEQLYQVDNKEDVEQIREKISEKKQQLELLWQEQHRIECEGQGGDMAICA